MRYKDPNGEFLDQATRPLKFPLHNECLGIPDRTVCCATLAFHSVTTPSRVLRPKFGICVERTATDTREIPNMRDRGPSEVKSSQNSQYKYIIYRPQMEGALSIKCMAPLEIALDSYE